MVYAIEWASLYSSAGFLSQTYGYVIGAWISLSLLGSLGCETGEL